MPTSKLIIMIEASFFVHFDSIHLFSRDRSQCWATGAVSGTLDTGTLATGTLNAMQRLPAVNTLVSALSNKLLGT